MRPCPEVALLTNAVGFGRVPVPAIIMEFVYEGEQVFTEDVDVDDIALVLVEVGVVLMVELLIAVELDEDLVEDVDLIWLLVDVEPATYRFPVGTPCEQSIKRCSWKTYGTRPAYLL